MTIIGRMRTIRWTISGESHQVELVPGSWLAELMGQPSIPVNSLHGPGIKTLAKGLEPLAHAEDGLIEAIRPRPLPFLLAVQWHPEWKAARTLTPSRSSRPLATPAGPALSASDAAG
jgi:gamma-glutamyl-gamma-aminobutyrate hydrolase PuuD